MGIGLFCAVKGKKRSKRNGLNRQDKRDGLPELMP
jgi:hypothetical protein